MNNEPTYTKDQHALIAELAATYGVEPDQIRFFSADPRPFFDHEAAAAICRRLAGARGIKNHQVASINADSISMECEITFDDGFTSSAVGVANTNETIDGKPMTEEQLKRLATSRAMRGTLVNAGVDLLKLHNQKMFGTVTDISTRTNRQKLSNEAHALGEEVCAIVGKNKTVWMKMLLKRYGVFTSTTLSDEQLADLVAFLKTFTQPQQMAA